MEKGWDPCIHDLRALKYTSQGLQYKLRFTNELQDLPIRSISAAKPKDISCISGLHRERLKIQKRKYDEPAEFKINHPCRLPLILRELALGHDCSFTISFITVHAYYLP